MKNYSLRQATKGDAQLLFEIKKGGMESTVSLLRKKPIEYEREFQEYLTKFEPEKIQVIQHEGKDVGRLRIVRSPASIYIGGIQILPEFQNMGIGTTIMKDLISESELTRIPVTLEVHHVNKGAISFYKKLGFNEVGANERQLLMAYTPKGL